MKKVIEYISVVFFIKLNFETCDTPPPKKNKNKNKTKQNKTKKQKFIANIYLQSVEGD